MAKLSPTKAKPATSVRSVGGMNACATSRCDSGESDSPSGSGNWNPLLLSKGLFEREAKREFHMRLGKKAVLIAIGVRRMLRGPVRCGPTMPLFSMPMAIDCVSPKPLVGEWQPPQVLSLFNPVRVSNHSSLPRSASFELIE